MPSPLVDSGDQPIAFSVRVVHVSIRSHDPLILVPPHVHAERPEVEPERIGMLEGKRNHTGTARALHRCAHGDASRAQSIDQVAGEVEYPPLDLRWRDI